VYVSLTRSLTHSLYDAHVIVIVLPDLLTLETVNAADISETYM